MQQLIAAHMLKNISGLKADLHQYDIDLLLEIRYDAAYIYTRSYPGLHGLPVGAAAAVLCC